MGRSSSETLPSGCRAASTRAPLVVSPQPSGVNTNTGKSDQAG